MISFRYHLVSIVAVFLALALGILVGTTVVNEGLVSDLERRSDDAYERVRALEREVSDLRTELRTWVRFGNEVQPLLTRGQLIGREVLLVTLENVDLSQLDGVRSALEEAGASVTAVLVVTPKMALTDDAARSELAGLLQQAPSHSADTLAEQAGRELGSRLAAGPDPNGEDVLEKLVNARFLELRAVAEGLQDIGGIQQAVVIVAEEAEGAPVDPQAFLGPLTKSLAEAVQPVVAAETTNSDAFVSAVRDDGSLDGQVVTVDDVDLVWGRVALVLGLRDLILSPGGGGDYGVKDGAAALLPTP